MPRQELGKMLLEAKIVSPQQLDEAVQNQVIYGGRLGTNLLELGYIDEHTLSRFLAKQHNVPTVDWSSLVNIRTGLFKLFPKKLAQKYEALPIKIEKNQLYVIMADPSHVGTISDMSFVTGKAIKPLVLPEVRIYELLQRFYGIGRELRYINLAIMAKPKSKEVKPKAPVAKITPMKAAEAELKAKFKSEAGKELISEEEFSQLQEQVHKAEESPLDVGLPAKEEKPPLVEVPAGRPVPRGGPQPFKEVAQSVYSVLIRHGVEQYVAKTTLQDFLKKYVSDQLKDRIFPLRVLANYLLAEANVQLNWLEMVLGEIKKLEPQLDVLILLPGEQPSVAAPPAEAEELEELFELEELESAEEIEELEQIEAIEELEEVEEVEEVREIEQLTLAQAQERLLNDVNDRTDVSRIVLGFAQGYFKRSALFTVRDNQVFGWDGLGGILNQKLLESIMLGLDQASVFKTVYDTNCHYLGPMITIPENDQFLQKLGGERPNNVFIIPIVVNQKVVYMLYGDNGQGQNVPFDIGELLILAQKIPQSINELIRRKRSGHQPPQSG